MEPERTKSCRIQGESVRLYVRTSIRTSPPPLGLVTLISWPRPLLDEQKDRQTDRRTYVHTYIQIPREFYRTLTPCGCLWSRCPAYTIAAIAKYHLGNRYSTKMTYWLFLQGAPSHLIFKESINLSFCVQYSYCEN